jgi:hypothetical protein
VGRRRSAELLAAAVVRVARRQPHGLCGAVPRQDIPPLPDAVVAFADCAGNLETTIPHAAVPPAGGRLRVRIGDVAATARVTDGSAPVADGELALAPSSASGGRRRFAELSLPGGSAASLFGSPRGGEPIRLAPAEL